MAPTTKFTPGTQGYRHPLGSHMPACPGGRSPVPALSLSVPGHSTLSDLGQGRQEQGRKPSSFQLRLWGSWPRCSPRDRRSLATQSFKGQAHGGGQDPIPDLHAGQQGKYKGCVCQAAAVCEVPPPQDLMSITFVALSFQQPCEVYGVIPVTDLKT